jgi:hypothetical protein
LTATADILKLAYLGWAYNTLPNNSKFKVFQDSESATDKITEWGIGSPGTGSNIYLEYKLKRMKRYNSSSLVKDMSSTVAPDTLKWNFKQIGNTDANKFYLFAHASQVQDDAAPTKTDHKVYHLTIVPRHASSSVQTAITKANAQVVSNTNFLKHDVCFNQTKTAAQPACQGPDKTLTEVDASFFMQVNASANHNSTSYDKIKYTSDWTVKNECENAQDKIKKCYNW